MNDVSENFVEILF
uniref:Uncharacterized protein n=1 Tax=Arundo donax TaxID=35708 RepID=A0A0A9EL10_ARUDO